MAIGKLSPHVNAGYTASTKGALLDASLNDEWNYAVGFDLAVSPRLTLIADVLGRSIREAGRLTEADKVFEFVQTGAGGGGRRQAAVAAGWRRGWRRINSDARRVR